MQRGLTEKAWDDYARLMADPRLLLDRFDEAGVERACLINYVAPETMGFDATSNEWVSKYCREAPDRLIATGSVHPRHTDDPAGETSRLIEALGIRMIKIHPPHQLFAEVYHVASEARVPVMFHTGTSIFPGARNRFADPMAVDDVAVDFPQLVLILAHAGRPLWVETAMFLARRHRNVYLDLSGIPPRKLLEYLPRLAEIADRCLWGTDWPSPGVVSMKSNLDEFLGIPLSDEVRTKILWTNSAEVFRCT